MNTNMPQFTAEASLFNVSTRYQITTMASFKGGIVQPAQFNLFYPDRPIYCLKYRCIQFPNRNPFCWRVLGIWNPVTASCE